MFLHWQPLGADSLELLTWTWDRGTWSNRTKAGNRLRSGWPFFLRWEIIYIQFLSFLRRTCKRNTIHHFLMWLHSLLLFYKGFGFYGVCKKSLPNPSSQILFPLNVSTNCIVLLLCVFKCSVHLCVYIFASVGAYVYTGTHTCEGLKLSTNVFLNCSPLMGWKHSLSFDPRTQRFS